MKKSMLAFLTVVGTAGGLLLAIGMCMCLLPEWNAFTPGVILAAIGAVTLLACWPIARRAAGKAAIRLTGRAVAAILPGAAGVAALGIGLVNCLQTVTVFGLAVGIVGLVLILVSVLAGRKAAGKRALPFNGKLVLTYSIGVVGALVLGVGMCLTMVWGASYMIPGIVVGCVGLLVCVLNLVLGLGKQQA